MHVGSYWKYLSNASNQGTAWRAPSFNDSNWSTGLAQLGYGDSDESTLISPKGVTSYFRRQFNVSDPSIKECGNVTPFGTPYEELTRALL